MLTTLSTEKVAGQAAKLLAAIANARRLVILDIISQQETSAGSLAEQVGLSQSALSQHLAKLRSAKLVNTRRDAQTIYYSCNSDIANRLLGTVHEILGLPLHSVIIGHSAPGTDIKRQIVSTTA
ncbi:ArsR/SmtB family transcription factor [Agrobacterium rubi]|uniref:ArsR/SmtB family transcription factor n=1 Tax=Agrobacterium rubi TaxID=28099 RepID=UPI00201B8AF6|nr:metalloregulator ArsR/SmtB family transcription factor [Agrobacterium rubi]